jgi:hypothetical protein
LKPVLKAGFLWAFFIPWPYFFERIRTAMIPNAGGGTIKEVRGKLRDTGIWHSNSGMDAQMVPNLSQKNDLDRTYVQEIKHLNPCKGLKVARKLRSGEIAMKINEDWLSVIIAFALMLLALLGVITPTLVTF